MKSVSWLALVALVLVLPVQTDAQQITGTVRDQSSGIAVANAQVFIEALNIGVLTQASGQYLLLGVPAGTHTVTVSSLGYGTASNEVTVTEGGTAVLDFIIRAGARQRGELLVAGSARGGRARERDTAASHLGHHRAGDEPGTFGT